MEDNAVGGDRCGEHGHGVQKVCQGRRPIQSYECLVVLILTCAFIEMINQGTPMTNIWLVTKWALTAVLL